MYALKRVALDRADAEAYQSYTNEIELLKRLRGHDRIIRLIDHQISFGPGNRPKILMMVSYTDPPDDKADAVGHGVRRDRFRRSAR
jgi:serine/threonine-protein kinase TTK/MPS1